MKKYISILMVCICMGMQYSTAAADPCAYRFAIGYAYAAQTLFQGEVACNDALWNGPCVEEMHRIFRNTVHNLQQNFSGCCCENGYTSCCN